MANIYESHSKYIQRLETNKNEKESCIHNRILEDANKTFKGNKKKLKLRSLKVI